MTSTPAEPKAVSQDTLRRGADAIDAVLEGWRGRYPVVVADARLRADADEAGPRPPRLTGTVLVERQAQALRAALAAAGLEHRDELVVLADSDLGRGWARGTGVGVDLLAAPGGGLATQWRRGDPPLRLLAAREGWWAVQAADGTVGWAEADALTVLDPGDGPDRLAWLADFAGRWSEPAPGAWRAAAAPWLGRPYVWGGSSDTGVDCSGYAQRLVKAVAGLGLPKHSGDQVRLGRRVGPADLRPGDLLSLSHRGRRIGHVALVVEPEGGRPWVTHANLDGGGVCLEPLDTLLQRYALRSIRRLDGVPAAAPDREEPSGDRAAPLGLLAEISGAPPLRPLPLTRDPADGWAWLEGIRDAEVHVVGYTSAEGAAVAVFLWREGFRRLVLHDLCPEGEAEAAFRRLQLGLDPAQRDHAWAELREVGAPRRHGPDYLAGIERADLVFAGQAWYLYPANLAALEPMAAAGRLSGLMELYFRLSAAPIIAVSGSNGKSTTSRWIEHILRQAGGHPDLGAIVFAGNERHGVQVASRLRSLGPRDRLVLEVSNRHLRGLAPKPEIGVLTAILPNHLDEHGGGFDAYVQVKRRLLASQDGRDATVLNLDDPACAGLADGLPGRVHAFSLRGAVERGAWLEGDTIYLRLDDGAPPIALEGGGRIQLAGEHNLANAVAAALAAALAGALPDQIVRGLRSFTGLRHRLQRVWSWRGIDCYDDLNSTTPQATLAALAALPAPVVLIAGGDDKGLDLDGLVDRIAGQARAVLLLPGAGSDRLEAELIRRGARPRQVADLVEAVERGLAAARAGDTLLLSPAFPGFFSRNYRDAAGREVGFRSLLRRLTTAQPPAPAAAGPHDSP